MSMLASVVGRVLVARRVAGMGIRRWIRSAVLPVAAAAVPAAAAGLLPRLWAVPSFGRVCLTALLVECVFLPLAWFAVLDGDDRRRIASFLKRSA